MTLSAFALMLSFSAAASAQDDPERPAGVVMHEAGAFSGYTLIAPLRSLKTYLLDMEGNVVHEWQSELRPGNSVYLKENSNLLRCAREPDNPIFQGGGQGGRVQEYTWDGELVWDFVFSDEKKLLHHDIEPLPGGNVLLIAWERKSYDRALEAGRDKALMESGELWPDYVVEIEPVLPDGGKIVWEWHVWDHLIQDHDPERDNFGDVAAHPERVDINADRVHKREPPKEQEAEKAKMRALGYLGGATPAGDERERRNTKGADWLHTNAIDYHSERDLIVLSIPNLNEFWIIDHSTTTEEASGRRGGRHGRGGDLLYRWGNPQVHRAGTMKDRRLFRQHDAQWIEGDCPGAGNILVFNNGRDRPGGETSTVDEILTPLDADGRYQLDKAPRDPVWSYPGTGREPFYSSFISGAQRLPNGNTLICSGAEGRVFEVSPDGAIVWDFWNPLGGDAPKEGSGRGGMNPHGLFRVTRLPPDHPGLSSLR